MHLVALSLEAHEPEVPAAFWSAMLGRDVVRDAEGALLPGSEVQIGLRFDATPIEDRSRPNRVHLHLTSSDPADQRHTVEQAVALGGRVIRDDPDGEVVMADPGRNEFCVIEPGNGFLAGCGRLAEVTGEGSRAVGLFWSEALGWPLVWDHGEQTAIQSPHGGTKISWDVDPDPTRYGTKRQRLVLSATDPTSEATRLVALGAVDLGSRGGRLVLADPDGNEFLLDVVDS